LVVKSNEKKKRCGKARYESPYGLLDAQRSKQAHLYRPKVVRGKKKTGEPKTKKKKKKKVMALGNEKKVTIFEQNFDRGGMK